MTSRERPSHLHFLDRLAILIDREEIAARIFLLPALVFLSVFLIFPIVYLGYLSFTGGSFTRSGVHWVGLNNYLRLLLTPDFWQQSRNFESPRITRKQPE